MFNANRLTINAYRIVGAQGLKDYINCEQDVDQHALNHIDRPTTKHPIQPNLIKPIQQISQPIKLVTSIEDTQQIQQIKPIQHISTYSK